MSGPEATGVRFGRRQSKGLLLGFTGPRVAAIGAGLTILLLGAFLAGPHGITVTAPVTATLVASALIRVSGRTLIEWAPVTGQWWLRRIAGQDRYLVRPCRPRPAGTLALPGDAAALRLHVDSVSGAAMIHDPHRRTLTAVAGISHPAFVLLAGSDQQRRVTAWGRALATLAATGHCAAVQILETTIPDPGSDITGYWQRHGQHDGSWAARNYADFISAAAPVSSRHTTTVSLTLDLARGARAVHRAGRGLTGAATLLRQDMATLTAALLAADLNVQTWLPPDDLARLIRASYDPAGNPPMAVGRDVATAGPVAIEEEWDHLTSDAGVSAVLWISEWARTAVHPDFLHSLILHSRARKTFTLLIRPVPAAEAVRAIRKQKVDYVTDAAQKARLGQLADYTDAQEYQDLLDREQELAAGHADLQYAGLLSVTAPTLDALNAAVAEVQRAAISCGCETRRLLGQQSQAFIAAALPFGRGL